MCSKITQFQIINDLLTYEYELLFHVSVQPDEQREGVGL